MSGGSSHGGEVSPSQLLREIDAYCRATGTPKSIFGRMAANDTKLNVRRARAESLRQGTAERLRAFMRDNPDGLRERPKGRPPRDAVCDDVPADGLVPVGAVDKFRLDAVEGSRELLRAMLRLGLRMGGLPGLDAETFAVRCAAFGIGGKRGAAFAHHQKQGEVA